jgi:hypothetical protein
MKLPRWGHGKRLGAGILGLIGVVALLLGPTLPAVADDTAERLTVEASVSSEGALTVVTQFDFAGTAPDPLVQDFTTAVDLGTGQRIEYVIDDIVAKVGGQVVVTTEAAKDGHLVVTIPTGAAAGPVTLSYAVTGVTRANPDDSVRFTWGVLQGLNIAVAEVTGKVDLPAGVIDYVCESGSPATLTTCRTYTGGTHGSNAMTFTDGPRAPGDLVSVGAVLEPGAVPVTARYADVWSVSRAFTLNWQRIALAVAIVAGGYVLLFGLSRHVRRRVEGRLGTPIAELAPDEQGYTTFALLDRVRPGMIGTLIDQSVDPNDILATLIDLAVRGHLRISELPRPSVYAVPDWTLTRRESEDPLDDYERQLLDAVAPPGASTFVSQITAAVIPAVGQVQSSLYRRVVAAGWFARQPGSRSRSSLVAWVGLGLAVVVGVALVVWTTWAILGPALIAVALIGLLVSQDTPVLTAEGASVLTGLGEFAGQLHNAPTTLRPDEALAEASAILPYAIVLGSWDRWLEALVAANAVEKIDATELDWYHGPEGWEFQDLPACLGAFITVVTGRLFARA